MSRGLFTLRSARVFSLEVQHKVDTFTECFGEVVMVSRKATEPLAELLTVRKGKERDIDGREVLLIRVRAGGIVVVVVVVRIGMEKGCFLVILGLVGMMVVDVLTVGVCVHKLPVTNKKPSKQ